ncbi:MAG TPA: hypothetical protein VEJ86_06275 [Candidatus Binataceae bacterium]|nr:hypothetical protein [Candidatus Binataceae bacterium]
MPEPEPIASRFPVAWCEPCAKSVLTCVVLDHDSAERRACVHCDTIIVHVLEWISAAELESTGYDLGRPRPKVVGGCGAGCSCSARRA